VAEKCHYYPTPCTALWRKGEGECYLHGPEDLLHKNESYTSIIIKSVLKMTFLMKTSEKKFVKIFCEAFLILKKYFA
jgi:hypothetical protein